MGEEGHLDCDIGHPVEGSGTEFFDQIGSFFKDLVIELLGAIVFFLEDLKEELSDLMCVLSGAIAVGDDLLELGIDAGLGEEVAEDLEHGCNGRGEV